VSQRHFLLTPRWWGINLFTLLAIPFCVFMGTWQLSRFEARVESHQQTEQRLAVEDKAGAQPLSAALPLTPDSVGRRVTAEGQYVGQLLVPDRELDGKQGFYVLGLLHTAQDGGRVLPVVRGWVPGSADTAKVPAAPDGTETVVGALQAPENAGTSGVNSRGGLPVGQVGMISGASLVNLVPFELYDTWITLTTGDDGMRAVPAVAAQGSGLDLKAFQNLGYTGEWFVFAAFVLFMWFRLVRREVEVERDRRLGLTA
jgi:cytochrome oxidase assembly protein ShyY1